MTSLLSQQLKAEIKRISRILQESPEKLPPSWITITNNFMRSLDSYSIGLNTLTKDFEELAIFLLLRSTTKLESIHSSEIHSVAKEIFQRIKGLKFSEAVSCGIAEFLSTPVPRLSESQIESEIEHLTQQIQSLQQGLDHYPLLPNASKIMSNLYSTHPQTTSLQTGVKSTEARLKDCKDQKEMLTRDKKMTELKRLELRGNFEEERMISLEELMDIRENERKNYSFCILDIEGNFIMADKKAETYFETRHEELLKCNLFDLMIPYSLFYLKKTMGESIFSSLDSHPKTFSYTTYSGHALKRYQKEITRMNRKGYEERKKVNKQKFSVEEKSLINEDNSIYYKYLQTLTSRATLIELKFSRVEDIVKLENTQDVRVKLEHEIFRGPLETQGMTSQPAVLLVTRKAYHIQKFKYALMEEYDEKIIKMEEKVARNLNKKSIKLAKKEENFRVKVELNNDMESDSVRASGDIFQEEETPSP